MDHVAKKSESLVYTTETARLSDAVLTKLHVVKASPTLAVLKRFQLDLEPLLLRSIMRVATATYFDAAKQVGYTPSLDVTMSLELRSRAKQAAQWIADTTGASLEIKAAMSKKQAISQGRADKIAVNELSLAFFGGTRYGWGLDPLARKAWLLSFRHDKDDTCDDNADEGPILIRAAFQSGHFIPPAHINCECELGLVRGKQRTY